MAFEVFISYSHQDQKLRKELEKHLSNLKRAQIILLLAADHPDPDFLTFLFQNSLTKRRTGAVATLSGSL